MSEIRDYGFDGATLAQLNTSPSPMRPSNIDLEAQSPQAPVQVQEKENRHPISPIEYAHFVAHSSNAGRCLELQDIF